MVEVADMIALFDGPLNLNALDHRHIVSSCPQIYRLKCTLPQVNSSMFFPRSCIIMHRLTLP